MVSIYKVCLCLTVSKTKFQHFVTTTFFFARFSSKALFLWSFCENLTQLRIFGFFFLWCKGWASNNESTWYFLSVLEKLQLKHLSCFKKLNLWWWHDVKNSSFWVAKEVQRGKRGGGRWSQKWEAIHKQNRWKCWACETKVVDRSSSYC